MTSDKGNPFRFVDHESVHEESILQQCSRSHRSHWAARVLGAIVSMGLTVLPVGAAFAGEQVLEIPQVTSAPAEASVSRKPHYATTYAERDEYGNETPGSYVDPAAGAKDPTDPPDTVVANDKASAPDPNVGSISDYENEQGENAQPRIALGGGRAPRNEPQSSMTTNLIVGGLIVGLVALEIASHHRRR